MRGINNNFNLLALAFVFFFAVTLVSLPVLASHIMSSVGIELKPDSDSYINGNYLLNYTLTNATETNRSFYYFNTTTYQAFIYTNTTAGTEFTYDWNTTTISDGIYDIKVNGTSGLYATINTNITIDNNPPLITLEYPLNNTTYTNHTLDLNYTTIDTVAVDSCWYNLNGDVTDLPSCANLNLTGAEGINWLVVFANDTTGNIGESSNISFEVDTTPPTIVVITPEDGYNYSDTNIDLNYTVYDLNGVDNCWYDLNDNITYLSDCNNTNITGVTGDNWLIFYANDTLGNENQSSNITFLIDDVDPVIHEVTMGPIPTATDKPFTITVNATDNIDLNLTVIAELFNTTDYSFGTVTLNQTGDELYSVDFAFPDVESGDYRYDITVTDFVGNDATLGGADFEVDNTAPVLSNLLPTGSSTNRYPELEVDTDENATCRFDSSNISYENMTMNFSSTNRLAHIYDLGKQGYGTYTYYVKCSDDLDNIGEGIIEFTVKKSSSSGGSTPTTPPVYNNNINDTTTGSNYTEEDPSEESFSSGEYETPKEEIIEEPTDTGPSGMFLFPEGSISLATILMGIVVVFALSSLIFRKELAEAIDKVRWRHY